jgi:hypothetical protein
VAAPYSRIARRRTHGSRHGLTVSGTAGEHRCATASAANRRRQRLARVYVMVYRLAAHRRCRFIERSGALSRPRSCRRPIEFVARGTSRWSLRRQLSLAPGRYLIRSVAIDRLHHGEPRSAASRASITIR